MLISRSRDACGSCGPRRSPSFPARARVGQPRNSPGEVPKIFLAGAAGALAWLGAVTAQAAGDTVVVAYQTDALPSSVAIVNGEFDKATGVKNDFRRFNSGAEIFAAIASGDVQVGYVGSSPFAAATSRGLDVKAFYLASISGVDEALVVRDGSGVKLLADLKGKKLAAAPVSTDHYQLLALIKSLGLTEKDVQVFTIRSPTLSQATTAAISTVASSGTRRSPNSRSTARFSSRRRRSPRKAPRPSPRGWRPAPSPRRIRTS